MPTGVGKLPVSPEIKPKQKKTRIGRNTLINFDNITQFQMREINLLANKNNNFFKIS